MTVSGRRLAKQFNNQLIVGDHGQGVVGEGTRPRQNMLGGHFGIISANKFSGAKIKKQKYIVA